MSEPTQPSAQRRRYPSLNLQQAIERAQMLYDIERLNPAPVDVIAQHWGYKNSKSGPASSAYSAVKQFGLLQETGSAGQRKAAISPRARAILTAPADVRDREIREAALEPTVNRLVWERYGADTGSGDAFRWHLISELGFSDTGAHEFAKQYEATIRFAGLDQLTSEEDDDERSDEGDGAGAVPWAANPLDLLSGASVPTRQQAAAVHQEPNQPASRATRHAIPLIGGKQVILEGEFPLTEAAWTGFMAVLAAFKPGLVVDEDQSRQEGRDPGSVEA